MSADKAPGVVFIVGRERMGHVPVYLGKYAGAALNSEPVCIFPRTYHPWFDEWIRRQRPPAEIVRQHDGGEPIPVGPPSTLAQEAAIPKIITPCPACGATSLFIGTGGHLTCGVLGCKDPSPAHAVEVLRASLKDAEERASSAERRTRSFATDLFAAAERMNHANAERDALVGCVRMLTEKVEVLERKIARAAEANDQEIPF